MTNRKTAPPQPRQLGSFIVPSQAEIGLLGLTGLVLMIIYNRLFLWELVTTGASVPTLPFYRVIQPQIDYINSFFSRPLFGKVSVMVLWVLVGCLGYLVIAATQVIYQQIKQGFAEKTYVRPHSATTYLQSRASQYLSFSCVSIILMTVLLVCLVFALPFCADLFKAAFSSGSLTASLHYGLASVGLCTVIVYIIKRLASSVWYLYKDLFRT